MKKLKLDLGSIVVATFQAGESPAVQGTVQAHLATPTCPSTRVVDTCGCSAEEVTCYTCG